MLRTRDPEPHAGAHRSHRAQRWSELVRAVCDADADAIYEACQDPDIQGRTVVPSPYTREDAETFLALSREGLADGSGAHMVVIDGASGELLGACGLSVGRLDLDGQIGYWTAASARGQGVATAAARLVCRWAFESSDSAASP